MIKSLVYPHPCPCLCYGSHTSGSTRVIDNPAEVSSGGDTKGLWDTVYPLLVVALLGTIVCLLGLLHWRSAQHSAAIKELVAEHAHALIRAPSKGVCPLTRTRSSCSYAGPEAEFVGKRDESFEPYGAGCVLTSLAEMSDVDVECGTESPPHLTPFPSWKTPGKPPPPPFSDRCCPPQGPALGLFPWIRLLRMALHCATLHCTAQLPCRPSLCSHCVAASLALRQCVASHDIHRAAQAAPSPSYGPFCGPIKRLSSPALPLAAGLWAGTAAAWPTGPAVGVQPSPVVLNASWAEGCGAQQGASLCAYHCPLPHTHP